MTGGGVLQRGSIMITPPRLPHRPHRLWPRAAHGDRAGHLQCGLHECSFVRDKLAGESATVCSKK